MSTAPIAMMVITARPSRIHQRFIAGLLKRPPAKPTHIPRRSRWYRVAVVSRLVLGIALKVFGLTQASTTNQLVGYRTLTSGGTTTSQQRSNTFGMGASPYSSRGK
jgi:hypothetical protein